MPKTITDTRLAELDTEILAARSEHREARILCAHSPCAETVEAEEQASDRVDELLDRRLVHGGQN